MKAAPIIAIRHPEVMPDHYDVVLRWAEENAPEVRRNITVIDLPADDLSLDGARLAVFWLQDPVQAWSTEAYEQACALSSRFERIGVPVINHPANLVNAGKARGAALISGAGLRTPRAALVTDADAFRRDLLGLRLPLLLREDWLHGSIILRADTHDEARALPVHRFRRPVAMEVVDVRDPRDGLYGKYRYVACGETGVSHHLQVSEDWITRGEGRVLNEITRAEEAAYVAHPDPHHTLFQAARRELGLEFVAFDYGYDVRGQPVVWEANPFPRLIFPASDPVRRRAMHRTVAALLRFYLRSAGLGVPDLLDQVAAYPSTVEPAAESTSASLRAPESRHPTAP